MFDLFVFSIYFLLLSAIPFFHVNFIEYSTIQILYFTFNFAPLYNLPSAEVI